MHRVGTKGQVVIEKEIRDRLGVEAGWIALQRVVDGHVEITFLPPEHRESLAGSLAPFIQPVDPSMSWDEIRETARRAAAEDRMRRMNGDRD